MKYTSSSITHILNFGRNPSTTLAGHGIDLSALRALRWLKSAKETETGEWEQLVPRFSLLNKY